MKVVFGYISQISVLDSDTTSDDVLGERDIDLRKQYYWPSAETGDPIAVDVYKNGIVAGTVNISFSKSPKKPGQAKRMPADQASTTWIPKKHNDPPKPVPEVVYRRKKPCESLCCFAMCCCCCTETEVTRAAVPVATAAQLPANFREVGYRLDLDGKWDRQNFAAQEVHRLDINVDNSLTIGARVEVPLAYNISTSPVPLPTRVSHAVYSSPPVRQAVYASPQVQNSMTQPAQSVGWASPALPTGRGLTPKLRFGI